MLIFDNSTKSRMSLTPWIAPLKLYNLPLFWLLPKFWKNSGKCSDKVWTNLDIVLTISSQAFLASALRTSSSRSQFMGNRFGITKTVNLGGSNGLSPAKKTPHRYEFLEKKVYVNISLMITLTWLNLLCSNISFFQQFVEFWIEFITGIFQFSIILSKGCSKNTNGKYHKNETVL